MVIKVLYPLETNLVRGPSIICGLDDPTAWQVALLVPACQMVLRGQDDERWDSPSRGIDILDNCCPHPVPWLASFALPLPSELVTTIPGKIIPLAYYFLGRRQDSQAVGKLNLCKALPTDSRPGSLGYLRAADKSAQTTASLSGRTALIRRFLSAKPRS